MVRGKLHTPYKGEIMKQMDLFHQKARTEHHTHSSAFQKHLQPLQQGCDNLAQGQDQSGQGLQENSPRPIRDDRQQGLISADMTDLSNVSSLVERMEKRVHIRAIVRSCPRPTLSILGVRVKSTQRRVNLFLRWLEIREVPALILGRLKRSFQGSWRILFR